MLSMIIVWFFFFLKAATQLARLVQQERTQVVCSNKVGRNRLAQRHSRNGVGPMNIDLTYTFVYCFEGDLRIQTNDIQTNEEKNKT